MSMKTKLKTIAIATLGNKMMHGITMHVRKIFYRKNYILCLNMHDTPMAEHDSFEKQLKFFSQYFDIIDRDEFDKVIKFGVIRNRPAVFFTFDDGLRSNFQMAAPLIEKYGGRGAFLIPNAFIDSASAQSAEEEAARAHDFNIILRGGIEVSDPRISMSWDEISELGKRGHSIGCHTNSHLRLGPDVPPERMRREIMDAKAHLQNAVKSDIDTFCWVGGERKSYSRAAADLIKEAGFKYGYMSCSAPVTPKTDPLHIQRFNIESNWALDRVMFTISIFNQLKYLKKKKSVEIETNGFRH